MRERAGQHQSIVDLGRWAGLLVLACGTLGCGVPDVRPTPELAALAAELDEIETVQLQERSQSAPVPIEQATEELAGEIAEPKAAQPAVRLTLDEARAAALANNLDLKVQLLDPAIARQVVDEERAKFEWAFFGSVQYDKTELTEDGGPLSSGSYEAGVEAPLRTGGSIRASLPFGVTESDDPNFQGVSEAAVSVSIIQSLLRGAGTRVNTYSIRIATYEQGIVDAGTKLLAIAILGNVDVAYWRLFAARRELDVRREQYKLAQDQLEHARRKVEAGSAPKIEIVRAEAGLASRLEDTINAETVVRDRERQLKRIMNRDDLSLDSEVSILMATEPNPMGLDLDAGALATAAVENRMEMVRLRFQLAIDEGNVDLAWNGRLPDLTIGYTYGAVGRSGSLGHAFENILDVPSEDHSLGLSAVIPLGNRAAEARFRRARLERIRSEVDRARLEQLIREEVLDAVDELRQNWRRILAAEQGVVAAYRDYKVEQSQFQLGVRTSTDVLLAASRLADAQLRRIRAFAEYEIAQVRLAQATGTLLGHGRIQLKPATLDGT